MILKFERGKHYVITTSLCLFELQSFWFEINLKVQMSRLERKVEQVLGELWWFSIELGEQTTKSNGVSELFMATISRFFLFSILVKNVTKSSSRHTLLCPNQPTRMSNSCTSEKYKTNCSHACHKHTSYLSFHLHRHPVWLKYFTPKTRDFLQRFV